MLWGGSSLAASLNWFITLKSGHRPAHSTFRSIQRCTYRCSRIFNFKPDFRFIWVDFYNPRDWVANWYGLLWCLLWCGYSDLYLHSWAHVPDVGWCSLHTATLLWFLIEVPLSTFPADICNTHLEKWWLLSHYLQSHVRFTGKVKDRIQFCSFASSSFRKDLKKIVNTCQLWTRHTIGYNETLGLSGVNQGAREGVYALSDPT